ncbi:hypothetical protein YPPY47_1304, partial [Yersinia pestis PY-47]
MFQTEHLSATRH